MIAIQWAVGLKNGAERLSTNIVQTFTEVNIYLDEREKTILQNLGLVQTCLDRATVVIRVMKEQINALVLVLSPSAVRTDHEKLWAAVRYFSRFIKDMEEELVEVEDALQQASETFKNSQLKLREHLQVHFLDKKAAKTKCWQTVFTVLGTASFFIQVIGPLLTAAFAVIGGTGGNSIEETVWQQFEYYMKGFERLSDETKALQERLWDKHQQLIDIHTTLNTTGTLVGIQIETLPLQHFEIIQNNARALLEACETFFDRSKAKMLDWASN